MINHAEQIRSRVYGQYRNSPKMIQWLLINGEIGNELQSVIDDVITSYDIDIAIGKQLDIIGRIVGVGREVIGDITFQTTMFGRASSQFGRQSSQFSPQDVAGNEPLSDEYYRVLIRAKIAKNNSDATIDSIIKGVEFILPNGAPIVLRDNEDMSFAIDIYGSVSAIERKILSSIDVVPRPQGVKFSGYRVMSDVPANRTYFGNQSAQFGNISTQFRG